MIAPVELVLFDVGGVLSAEMIEDKLADLARRHDLALPRLLSHARRLRPAADLGQISDQAFWRQVLAAEGVAADEQDLAVAPYLRPVEGTLELVRRGLGGRRAGILSNDSVQLARARRERHGFDALFDPIVISAEVGLVKPDPGIYALAAARAGLPAARCLFVDDRPENVEGARRAGMQALLFRGAAPLSRELAALLGDVS